MGGKIWRPINEIVASAATTFANMFDLLLWQKFFHVKENQQSRDRYAVVIKKGEVAVGL